MTRLYRNEVLLLGRNWIRTKNFLRIDGSRRAWNFGRQQPVRICTCNDKTQYSTRMCKWDPQNLHSLALRSRTTSGDNLFAHFRGLFTCCTACTNISFSSDKQAFQRRELWPQCFPAFFQLIWSTFRLWPWQNVDRLPFSCFCKGPPPHTTAECQCPHWGGKTFIIAQTLRRRSRPDRDRDGSCFGSSENQWPESRPCCYLE